MKKKNEQDLQDCVISPQHFLSTGGLMVETGERRSVSKLHTYIIHESGAQLHNHQRAKGSDWAKRAGHVKWHKQVY